MYKINRLNLLDSLRRCLASATLIDYTDSGVRQLTRRVTNWQDAWMVLRWAAATFLETENRYRRIVGSEHVGVLKAFLDDPTGQQQIAQRHRAE